MSNKTQRCQAKNCETVLDWKNKIKLSQRESVCMDCYDKATNKFCTGIVTMDMVNTSNEVDEDLFKAEAKYILAIRKMRKYRQREGHTTQDPIDLLKQCAQRLRSESMRKHHVELCSLNQIGVTALLKDETKRYDELYGDEMLPTTDEGGGATARLRGKLRSFIEEPVFTNIPSPAES